MIVIKKGTLEVWLRGTCTSCGTVADAKRQEMTRLVYTRYGNVKEYGLAPCPECSTETAFWPKERN